jgi:hypothetical protein
VMMDGLGIFLPRVRPCLEHFEDEDVVSVDKAGVGDLAFDIGETLGHERRRVRVGGPSMSVTSDSSICSTASRISPANVSR